MELSRLVGLSKRRTAARLSSIYRDVSNRPFRSLVAVLLALVFWSAGNLQGRTSRVQSRFGTARVGDCPALGRCPPCDIPEGLKALIPPVPSKYEDLLKSTASRWLTPWDMYDFENASISTKMVDRLWEHMVSVAWRCCVLISLLWQGLLRHQSLCYW